MLRIIALLFAVHGAPASPDSLVGPWRIKGDVMGNPVNEVCTFTQAGTVLSGRCDSEDGEPSLLSGLHVYLGQHIVHAAKLSAQHPLHLAVAQPTSPGVDPRCHR